MVPSQFVYVAILIRLIGGIGYFRGVFTGKARPNPITWFIWGLTAMVAFAAQLREGVGLQAWVTFTLGLTPILICIAALWKGRSRSHFTFFNIGCGLLAIVGIVLWQITDDPRLAIVFSILADTFGSLPTIIKSLWHPDSEYPLPYLLSVLSMVVTLATIQQWNFATYAFPIYIAVINTIIFSAIIIGKRIARPPKPRQSYVR